MWAGLRGCGKDVIVPGQVFGELGPQGHVADSLSWGSFELAPFQPHVRACVCVCLCGWQEPWAGRASVVFIWGPA